MAAKNPRPGKRKMQNAQWAKAQSARQDELAKLREAVKRKQRNVNAKINRLEKNHGVNLRGTSYAPSIADAKKIGRYTGKQLEALAARLDAFTKRTTTFVAISGGEVVSGEAWNRYIAAQNKYNAFGQSIMQQVGGVQLPGVDSKGRPNNQTIAEREMTTRKDGKGLLGESAQKSYINVDLKARNVASAEALEILTRDMERKAKRQYLNNIVKRQRKQAEKMLEVMGSEELRRKVDDLSDYQFHILWEHTHFADAVGGKYAFAVKMAADSQPWYKYIIEDNSQDVEQFADWARQLPENAPTQRRAQAARKSNGRLRNNNGGNRRR
jgi:hypothetical protein